MAEKMRADVMQSIQVRTTAIHSQISVCCGVVLGYSTTVHSLLFISLWSTGLPQYTAAAHSRVLHTQGPPQ